MYYLRNVNGLPLGLPAALCCGLLVISQTAHALDLSSMITDSVSAHPEVKEKIHAYRRVLGDRDIADSGWRPSVDVGASSGVYHDDRPNNNNRSTDYDSSTVELSVTQNLFNGYDTTYQAEQADARIEAALYDVYDTADNVALRATQAFFEVIKQRQLYQLALENVAAHEDILAKIRERNLSGVGRRSELQQTEGRLARAEASLIAQQNNLEDALTLLHQILGRYVDAEVLREPELPARPAQDLDQLIEQALSDHPAMRVASSNIKAAQAEHLRSLRSRYPNVDLRLAQEYGDNIGGRSGDTEETSLILNLSYNIYRGGRDSAEQQQSVSAVYEQKEFAARVRRQVINTLRLSWTADDLLVRQLKFLEAHAIKSGQTVESYKEEFFIGQRDLIDLLDAENEFNTARRQYAEANYDAFAARYRVYEGIGHLFESAGVEFSLDDDRLLVARLDTARVDELPLPDDEDVDLKLDPLDQCDNSTRQSLVNPFGCLDTSDIDPLVVAIAAQNSQPELTDDSFEMDMDGMLVISRQQLLTNDRDAEDDSMEVVDVSQPRVGRLAFNGEGNLIYRPAEGFVGTDSFNYTVTDNQTDTVTATVTITVRKSSNIDLSKVYLVNFTYNSTEMTPSSNARVDAIIDKLRRSPNVITEIYTYTDSIGSEAFNLQLSQRRAAALKVRLMQNGIAGDTIVAIGVGEGQPVADNSTLAGQAINRRGVFVFRPRPAAE
jgi:adhesin transport system outer membrane protein